MIKLGLAPDPEGGDQNVKMTKEEREAQLREFGLFISKEDKEHMHAEMERIALENHNKMIEENLARLTKEELHTLKKLGMTDEEIAGLSQDQNPLKDQGLGGKKDPFALFEAQKVFYLEL